MKTQAIIPTAGLGTRLASMVPKPLVLINGKPLFIYALESFEKNYTKTLLLEIAKSLDSKDIMVISNPLFSLGGKKFNVKRHWLDEFLEEEFVILKRFELFGEQIIIIGKK